MYCGYTCAGKRYPGPSTTVLYRTHTVAIPVLGEGTLDPVLEGIILQHLVPGVAHPLLHLLPLLRLLLLLSLLLLLLLLTFLLNFCNSSKRL